MYFEREKVNHDSSHSYQNPPTCASPLNILPMDLKSRPSEQLMTMTYIARDFPRSFTVSVLPVPAGPLGLPPRWRCRAVVSVM